MKHQKLVYVAGALNSDAVGYLKNVHRMIVHAKKLRDAGYAVYVPCNDLLEGIVSGNFSYSNFFDNSQVILLRSDAVSLTPGWEESKGTQREIALAKENGIPVFEVLDDLIKSL